MIEQPTTDSDHLGRQGDGGALDDPAQDVGIDRGGIQSLGNLDGEHPTGAVERGDLTRRERRGLDHGHRRAREHERHPIDAIGLEHEGVQRLVVDLPDAGSAGDRDGAGYGPFGHGVGHRIAERSHERQKQRRRAEVRTGQHDDTGFLEEQRVIDQRPVTEHGPLAQVPPPQVIRDGRIAHVSPHQRRRTLLREERARGVAQHLLFVGKREIHPYSRLIARSRSPQHRRTTGRSLMISGDRARGLRSRFAGSRRCHRRSCRRGT